MTVFSLIDGYSDVDEQIKLCQYNQALEYIENNDFEDAFEIYNVISNYNELEERLFSSCYDYAQKLYDKNEYISAHNHFKMIENYRDSAEKMKELSTKDHIIQAMYAKVGDIIKFGTYEQNFDIEGREPIEWIVIDENDGQKLVVSKVCIASCQWTNDFDQLDWNNSVARIYLNDTFYNSVFSATEKECIALTQNEYTAYSIEINSYFNKYVKRDYNVISSDKVFLLSSKELDNKYKARLDELGYLVPGCSEVHAVHNEGFFT